jgi:hypothetical protein
MRRTSIDQTLGKVQTHIIGVYTRAGAASVVLDPTLGSERRRIPFDHCGHGVGHVVPAISLSLVAPSVTERRPVR